MIINSIINRFGNDSSLILAANKNIHQIYYRIHTKQHRKSVVMIFLLFLLTAINFGIIVNKKCSNYFITDIL